MAKQHVTMAEIWESEPEQLGEAIEHYKKASAIFRGEEQQSQANKCDLKAAQMLATNKNYQEALQLFEAVSLGLFFEKNLEKIRIFGGKKVSPPST